MNKITDAQFVRMAERNDTPCADVEVSLEGMEHTLLVEFTPSKDNNWDMTHIYKKEAYNDLDWYNNDLHQAYEDVTIQMFENEAQETNWGSREQFKQQVLAYEDVLRDMKEQFQIHDSGDGETNRTYLH